jgi:hypothetical protein
MLMVPLIFQANRKWRYARISHEAVLAKAMTAQGRVQGSQE